MTSQPSDSPFRRAADRGADALARRFGDVLRAGDGSAAERVVEDALAAGMAPEAIHSLVITPAMIRIGELWEARLIGVADEHLATSISQRALIALFETMSARRVTPRSRERVLLAAVEGQHHVLGLRMVADVLEGAGFDVLYLGEDVPVAGLLDFVAQHRPAVAGLAFGIAAQVSCLADSLWAIRELAPETRIMLGGRSVPPGLRSAGYPYVQSTMQVVAVVEKLLAGPPQALPTVVDLLRSDGVPRSLPREHAVETDVVAERLAKAADEAVDLAREHVRRAESYRVLAFRDPLTGMANRRAFEDALSTFPQNPGAGGAVLMIDVDAFKSINDVHGHQAGDRLLCAIGQAINGAVRPGDVAARVGGDEFAVLLPGAPPAVACRIGECIRVAVTACVDLPVSISIGVAALSADSRGSLLAADTALYDAKAGGRDRVVVAQLQPVGTDREQS